MSHLIIHENGDIQFIYEDDLAEFLQLGTATINRASHVEPHPEGGWLADMSPVGGPILGPFSLRSEALAAERQWLVEKGF